MSLVENIAVPPEYQDLWNKACVINSGSYGTKVDKKNIVFRRRNFTSLIARGNFQGLAQQWDSLTALQQADWDDAGYWSGQSGWDLFAQDTLYRINNNILGIATPNLYHQFKVGELKIESPAEEIQIYQTYYNLPDTEIEWAFNLFQNLTSTGAGSYAKLFVTVSTGYIIEETGLPEVIVYEYDLLELSDWEYWQDGYYDGIWGAGIIEFKIHIYKMTGVLYIDGIELNYNDQNFANDFQCNDFASYWGVITLPSGASFGSIYPPD
jgi:hypothetical protein